MSKLNIENSKISWKSAPDKDVSQAIENIQEYAPEARIIILEEALKRDLSTMTIEQVNEKIKSISIENEKQRKAQKDLENYNRRLDVVTLRILLSIPFVIIPFIGSQFIPEDFVNLKLGLYGFIVVVASMIWKAHFFRMNAKKNNNHNGSNPKVSYLSIVSLVLCWFPFVGFPLAISSIREISMSNGYLYGKTLAWISIMINGIVLAFHMFTFVIMFISISG